MGHLDGMSIPDGFVNAKGKWIVTPEVAALAEDIRKAEIVCTTYELTHGADTNSDFERDSAALEKDLEAWLASRCPIERAVHVRLVPPRLFSDRRSFLY